MNKKASGKNAGDTLCKPLDGKTASQILYPPGFSSPPVFGGEIPCPEVWRYGELK